MNGFNEAADVQVVMEAVGSELLRTRKQAGLTRPELIDHMSNKLSVQALATYENSIRHCSVVRFVEICQALGAPPGDLLSLALQRKLILLDSITLQINLVDLVRDRRPELLKLRKWALSLLDTGCGLVARLDQAELDSLAESVGCPRAELINQLVSFTPPNVPLRNG